MKKTNESGRSMVEMLGVLAIIGVLSVGGIAGYTMAMNRYRANEAIDIANKLAMIVYSSKQTYKTMHNGSDSGWSAPTLATSGLVVATSSNKFNGITFTVGEVVADQATDTDGVKITMTFDTDRVCQAAASILGVTCNSSSKEISNYLFKQS